MQATAPAPALTRPKSLHGPNPTPTALDRTQTFNILSWNCNGIRSPSMKANHPLTALFDAYAADIVCLQETKLTSFDDVTEALVPVGWDAFFSFSRGRKGLSGTATYVRQGLTVSAAEDLNDPRTDGEGRIVMTDHRKFVLFNVYFPNAMRGPERLAYKLKFFAAVEERARALLAQGRHVIIVGDYNVAHCEVDTHMTPTQAALITSGFLPEERAWMDGLLRTDLSHEKVQEQRAKQNGTTASTAVASDSSASLDYDPSFVPHPSLAAAPITAISPVSADASKPFLDSYRYFHPFTRNAYTFWDMRTAKRETNDGWRIDYMIVDESLLLAVGVDADIHPRQRGSDHCPTSLHFRLPPPTPQAVASTAAASTSSLSSPSRLQRLAAFLDLSTEYPLSSPTSVVSARAKAKFRSSTTKQGSLTGFFAKALAPTANAPAPAATATASSNASAIAAPSAPTLAASVSATGKRKSAEPRVATGGAAINNSPLAALFKKQKTAVGNGDVN